MTGATIPEGSVVITPTEMYKEMIATHQAVRDVSTKLDGALADHGRRLDGLDKNMADHEGRLRHVEQTGATAADVEALEKEHAPRIQSLERRFWVGVGAATILSPAAAALMTKLISGH